MKKIIISLMCVTMGLMAYAQPQQESQEMKQTPCPKMMFCPANCGIDSTTLKTVFEMRKKYRENYRKELRQTLGDEKYIEYLEFMVDKKQQKAMRKRMKANRKQWAKRRGQKGMGKGRFGKQADKGIANDKPNDKNKSKDTKKNKSKNNKK